MKPVSAASRCKNLDAVVGHHLARVARARVEEAGHLELDRAVGGGEVGELGLPAYRARQRPKMPRYLLKTYGVQTVAKGLSAIGRLSSESW